MALIDISQETRVVDAPDSQGRVEFRKAHSVSDDFADAGPLTLSGFSIRPYSNEYGGRAALSPDILAQTEQGTDSGNPTIDIDFTILTNTARPGTDHVITYEVEDGNGNTGEFEFFFQNGIWNPKDETSLSSRLSSEFERLSDTFGDGDFTASGITDFSDFDTWDVPNFDLHFVSESSELVRYNDETIPYYRAGGSESVLTAPEQIFVDGTNNGRRGSIFVVLQWDQVPSVDTPVFQIRQGSNVHMEVRNAQRDVAVESDFADATIYKQSTYAGELLLAELKIDTDSGEVRGAINREIDRNPVNTSGIFSSGDTEVVLNPNGDLEDVKLFELLVFPDVENFRFSNKVASMLSYLYNLNMTEDAHSITTSGTGSPDISNHLFYNARTDALDILLGFPNSLSKFAPDDTSEIWAVDTEGEISASASTSQGYAFFADPAEDSVVKLTKSGDEIWTFPDSDPNTSITGEGVRDVAVTNENVVVVSYGTDVRAVDIHGIQAWEFGDLANTITSVATTSQNRTYVATEGLDPVVVLLDSEGEEESRFDGHVSGTDVTSLVADSDGFAYSGAENGEIRFSNTSGNEELAITSTHDDTINALDVDADFLYTASADGAVKKINKNTTDEVWVLDFTDGVFIEDNIDAIDPNDDAKPDPDDVSLSPLDIAIDFNGNLYVVVRDANNEIEDIVFKVSELGNVTWVEIFDQAASVSVQPGLEASQWN